MEGEVEQELGAVFVNYAAGVLAETECGLRGPEIIKVTVAHAIENGVDLPHAITLFRPPTSGRHSRRTSWHFLSLFGIGFYTNSAIIQ